MVHEGRIGHGVPREHVEVGEPGPLVQPSAVIEVPA